MACQKDRGSTRAGEAYKTAKTNATKVVAVKREKVVEDIYSELDTREGEKNIYKVAKSIERNAKDIGPIRFIKYENGTVLVMKRTLNRMGKVFRESIE